MAVFKQELNWSTYQDKQLKVLESLERSFSSSVRTSSLIESNLDKLSNSIESMVGATKSIAEVISGLTAERRKSAEETNVFTNKLNEAANSLTALNRTTENHILIQDKYGGVIDHTAQKQEELAKVAEELARAEGEAAKLALEKAQREAKEYEDSLLRAERIRDTIGTILENASNSMRSIGRMADDYSTASNQLIRLSGVSGEEVRSFRSEFMGIVSDLNDSTGMAYNPLEQYERIIAVSQGVTSSLESISELSRPLLLAQETLDVNINDIADLFNKFYTRYQFSSSNMESTLNEIRGNTAGNSANAEATLQNIKSLENWIGYVAGNDNQQREEMMKSISHYTSWLESMNIDSSPYTEYLNAIAYGDYSSHPELANILTRSGLSSVQATEMAWGGQFEELTKALIDGVYSAFSTVEGSYAMGASIDNLSINRDMAMEAWNTINSAGFVSLEDFMEKAAEPHPTMTELVEDKYISATEKANNWLSKLYEKVAFIQEHLGFGLSDVAGLYVLLKGVQGGIDTIARGFFETSGRELTSSALSSLGTRSTLRGVITSSRLGGVGRAASSGLANVAALGGGIGGTAMLGGGLLAGAGLAIDGGKDLFSSETDAGTKILSGVEMAGGVGGAAALIGLGVTNPIGWAALAIGGVALLGKSIHKAATTIGETNAIEKAYEDAKNSVVNSSRDNEDTLTAIKQGLQDNLDLEQMRSDLINSGILSENDIENARNANKEGLLKLTEAYLKATDKFSETYETALDKYMRSDMEYASILKENLFKTLQEELDKGQLKDGSDKLGYVDTLFYSLYKDLNSQKASGVEFDKDTKKIYDTFVKAYEDGKLTEKEANSIIDKGFWNTTFKNANFGVDALVSGLDKVTSLSNAANMWTYGIAPLDKTYYGVEEASHVLELATKALHATNSASAVEYLDQLKSEGYTSEKYVEIGEAAKKWGLKGYAEGSNYITEDQIAMLHEGEAVIPKKYNPAANTQEMKELAEQTKRVHEETKHQSNESKEYMSAFIDELREIKEFLADWKLDNIKRENLMEAKSRHASSKSMIQQYLAY